jgi:4-carboxymuconolactone decarboxylase
MLETEKGGEVMSKSVALAVAVATVLCTAAHAQERMPPIPAEKMTDAQKKAVADYKTIRGSALTGPPWSVILRVPGLVVPSVQMRLHYVNEGVLHPRLIEFGILFAARRWTNNYEFNAHHDAAVKAGLKPEIIEAIVEGRRPDRMADDEEILYDFCTELQDNQSISDRTYARALEKFGEAGIVEMASIQGYYTYLAMIMNAARVTSPSKPRLERFPRLGPEAAR